MCIRDSLQIGRREARIYAQGKKYAHPLGIEKIIPYICSRDVYKRQVISFELAITSMLPHFIKMRLMTVFSYMAGLFFCHKPFLL